MDFWRLVELLNQRKWLILASVGVTLALTYGASRIRGAEWQATARFISTSTIMGGASEDPGAAAPQQQSDPGQMIAKPQAAAYAGIARRGKVLQRTPVAL